VLQVVEGTDRLQPSPQFTLTRWELFSCLSASKDHETTLRTFCHSSTNPPSITANSRSNPLVIADSFVDRIFQDPCSRNIFDQTTLHVAALHGLSGAIMPLFLLGQQKATIDDLHTFLSMPTHFDKNTLHLAAIFYPITISFHLSAKFQLFLSINTYIETIRKILIVETILDEFRATSLLSNHPNIRQLVNCLDSKGTSPINILLEFRHTSRLYKGVPSGFLDIVCDMLRALTSPLEKFEYGQLSRLWASIEDDNQALILRDTIASKDPEWFLSASHELFQYSFQMSPKNAKWATRMETIVKSNPNILRKKDSLGCTPLMICLGEFLQPIKVQYLVDAQVRYFGKCLDSTCHFLYLRKSCCEFRSTTPIFRILNTLGPDLTKPVLNRKTLLHFFGHSTKQHRRIGYRSIADEIFTCPYLDSAEDLLDLLDEHARLFERISGSIAAISTILKKIGSHIGYLAFILLCKCGAAGGDWMSDQRGQLKHSTLLDLLIQVVAAYRQKAESDTGILTIEIKLNGKSLRSFTTEEDVPLDEIRKYEDELRLLTGKLETLIKIEDSKWIPTDKGSSGRYQEGTWEGELEWARQFLSVSEITYLKTLDSGSI
jgi:hypothetical protein